MFVMLTLVIIMWACELDWVQSLNVLFLLEGFGLCWNLLRNCWRRARFFMTKSRHLAVEEKRSNRDVKTAFTNRKLIHDVMIFPFLSFFFQTAGRFVRRRKSLKELQASDHGTPDKSPTGLYQHFMLMTTSWSVPSRPAASAGTWF